MKSERAFASVCHSPLLAQASAGRVSPCLDLSEKRITIKPLAILEVVRRRGRTWGLLAQYEEARLGLSQ